MILFVAVKDFTVYCFYDDRVLQCVFVPLCRNTVKNEAVQIHTGRDVWGFFAGKSCICLMFESNMIFFFFYLTQRARLLPNISAPD